jgi:hypothetical protein
MTIRQSDLWRVLREGEATLGTYEVPDANTPTVPVISAPMAPTVRGTKIIARADVMTGRLGGVSGVPGSFGWEWTTEEEVQIIAGQPWAPWVLALAACGHYADFNAGTVTLTPSLLAPGNYAGGTSDSAPIAVSQTAIRNTGGVADECHRLASCVGVATLRFATNERLILSCAWKGLLVDSDLIDTSDTDQSDVGTWVGTGVPVVCTGYTLTLANEGGGSTLDNAGISSIELSQGASAPDVPDPSATDGLAISRALLPDSPKVTFTVGDTSTNSASLWAKARSGARLSLSATFAAGTTSIALTIPSIEIEDMVRADQDGYDVLQITGRVVQANLGTTTPLYSIAYDYTT